MITTDTQSPRLRGWQKTLIGIAVGIIGFYGLGTAAQVADGWVDSDEQLAWDAGEAHYFSNSISTSELDTTCLTLTAVHDRVATKMAAGDTQGANDYADAVRQVVNAELKAVARGEGLPVAFVTTGFWDTVVTDCRRAMFDLSGYAGRPSF